MSSQEFIENFHQDFWLNPNDLPYMNIWASYSHKENDNYYDRRKPNFNPFYEVHDCRAINIPEDWGIFGKTNDRDISEKMIFNHKFMINKYVGKNTKLTKKFNIGDYTFYIFFNSGTFRERGDSEKQPYQLDEFSVYLEYHGFTNRVLNLYTQEKIENGKLTQRSIVVKGYYVLLEFLKNAEDLVFEDYAIEDVFGKWEETYYFWLDSVTPKELSKYTKKKSQYSISRDYDINPQTREVDLDFFIKMFTINGIYKPNKKTFTLMNSFNNKPKAKVKFLKDLGVETVQFQNNSAYDITNFYDLTGVVIKCSESVLKHYESFRKFHVNKELADSVTKKEKEERIRQEKQRKAEIANDTYTLYQFGVPVLKDVRSYNILEYFENKSGNEFETQAIEAAKKVFNATSELDVIYFMHYGIYTYTELSGEKFSHYEDLEYINKLKGNKLPKRIVTLLNLGEIEFPYFDTYDKNADFERGATFIGVKKSGDTYTLVYEDGDQGI
jgi:hypothetical protein